MDWMNRFIIFCSFSIFSSAFARDTIFVTDQIGKKIFRAPLDSLEFEDIPVQKVDRPIAVDYDPVDHKLYWTDVGLQAIIRAKLDGTQEEIVVSDLEVPDGLSLDVINRYLYWTDSGAATIERANLDGTDKVIITRENHDEPRAIVVDSTGGRMYWTDWGSSPKIERAKVDGSNRIVLVDTDLQYPNGLAVDFEGNRLYWCDAGLNAIESTDLDGQNRVNMGTFRPQAVGIDIHPFDIGVYTDYLYLSDWSFGQLLKMNKSIGQNLDPVGAAVFERAAGLHIFKDDINECSSNPCNAGECIDEINFYTCNCTSTGFVGDRCEIKCVKLTINLATPDYTCAGLNDLNKVNVSNANVVEVAETLTQLTDRPGKVFTESEIDDFAHILENIVEVMNGSVEVTEPVVESVSNLIGSPAMKAPPTVQFTSTTSRIVQSLERQVSTSLEENDSLRVVESNVAVQGLKSEAPETDDVIEVIGIAILSDATSPFSNNSLKTIDDDFATGDDISSASILLSSSIVENLKEKSKDRLRFIFLAYRNDYLFPSKRAAKDNLTIDGIVLSATVEGVDPIDLSTLVEPVLIENQQNETSTGQKGIKNDTESGNKDIPARDYCQYPETECVYWDFEINDWSTEGCRYMGVDNGKHQCECDHLTNFAVLVYHGEKHILSDALDLISKIGCGLSIASLAITVIFFTLFKKLRSRARTIIVHLCLSLIGLYLVFLIGIDKTCPKVYCTVTAALLHYFVLTSMAWMTVEARILYIKLVRLFVPESDWFVTISASLAWGIPLIVVALSFGISLAVGSGDYRNVLYCFPKPGGFVVYFAVLLPIAVALIYNIITFGFIMKNLLLTKPGQMIKNSDRKLLIERYRRSITIMCLLGLTWVFGFFAIGSATLVFQWLFCIMNSLQGVFIFIFMCLTQNEVKKVLFSSCSDSRRSPANTGRFHVLKTF